MPPGSRSVVKPVASSPRSYSTESAADKHKSCWKCNADIPYLSMHCDNKDCEAIQKPPREVNFFEVLSAGTGHNHAVPTYRVDLKALRRNFLLIQQKVHPDSHSQSSERELAYAQTQSSLINKAYNTLKDPLPRAQYMLALHGIEVGESESLEDPELLMEVLEVREELEEAQTEEDAAKIKMENDAKYHATANAIAEAFETGDLEKAKALSVQLQYWENIRKAIVEWSPGKRVELKH